MYSWQHTSILMHKKQHEEKSTGKGVGKYSILHGNSYQRLLMTGPQRYKNPAACSTVHQDPPPPPKALPG